MVFHYYLQGQVSKKIPPMAWDLTLATGEKFVRRPIGKAIHCSTALPTVKAKMIPSFASMMLEILIFVIGCADFVAGNLENVFTKKQHDYLRIRKETL